jgi:hypothetical protein
MYRGHCARGNFGGGTTGDPEKANQPRMNTDKHELEQADAAFSRPTATASRSMGEENFFIRNTILQLRARTTKIWTAVAERSGDTAFRAAGCFQKRRGASLPAAVQNLWLRHKPR